MPVPSDRLHRLLLLILIAAHLVCGFLEANDANSRVLEANVPRQADSTRIGGPPARYLLTGLQQGKGYEVRVSFPGTAAVRVSLWLGSATRSGRGDGDGGLPSSGHRHSRKLLDAEKIMFSIDAEGRVWIPEQHRALSAPEVLFKAEAWGRWRQPGQAPQLLLYDIVLEQSTLGVPHSALPLIATAVLLVTLAATAAPWWSTRAVPALLLWLHGSSRTGHGGGQAPLQSVAAGAAKQRPKR